MSNDAPTPEHLQFSAWLEAIDTLRANDMAFTSVLKNHKDLYKKGTPALWQDFANHVQGPEFDAQWTEYERNHESERIAKPALLIEEDLLKHMEAIGLGDTAREVLAYQEDQRKGKADPANAPTQKHMVAVAIGYLSSIMGAKGPFSSAFLTWLLEDPARLSPEFYLNADGTEKSYDQLRGDLCEAFGQALVHGDVKQSLEDALSDHPQAGYSDLHKSTQFNDNIPMYLTKNAEGEWVQIEQQRLVEMLNDPDGPNILFTSNHAFHENRPDLTAVTDNVEKLANASIAAIKGPYSAITNDSLPNFLKTFDETSKLNSKDTITVCVSHTRENNFLNLAQLFHRLDEVEQHLGHPETDPMSYLAPTSRMVCETILQSIVKEPSKVKLHQDEQGKWQLFERNNPPTLRENAPEALNKAIFVGFSQGGNMMRDGLRFLTQELETLAPLAEAEKGNGYDIRRILGNINMTVMSCNVKQMDEFYRQRGVYSPILSNKADTIAPPPAFEHDPLDPKVDFDGFTDFFGHHPAMKIEGILKDNETRRYFRGAFARTGQAAAISMANVYNDTLYFEMAPGSDPVIFEAELKRMLDPDDKSQLLGENAYSFERAGEIGIGELADFKGPKGRVVYAIRPKDGYVPLFKQISDLHDITYKHHRIARLQRDPSATDHVYAEGESLLRETLKPEQVEAWNGTEEQNKEPIHLVYGAHVAHVLHDQRCIRGQRQISEGMGEQFEDNPIDSLDAYDRMAMYRKLANSYACNSVAYKDHANTEKPKNEVHPFALTARLEAEKTGQPYVGF